MKVILMQDINGLGTAGDLKEVAEGYARNFLVPNAKALPATPGNLKKWESQKHKVAKQREEEIKLAQEKAAVLEKTSCTILVKVGEGGKIFGSVTAAHIADSLKEEGYTVDKKDIMLAEPLKELGAYFVDVRLPHQVTAKVKVWIVQEDKE
jgi:large subunit ribosomal protein L9